MKNIIGYRFAAAVLAASSLALLAGCGGGSGGSNAGSGGNPIAPAANNVATVSVNAGPSDLAGGTSNTAFLSISLCVHGTTTCQTVPFVAIDTGSSGIRILKSKVTVSLTQQTDTSSNPMYECFPFVDGYTWGPVQTADVTISGTNETASNIPVQVVDDQNAYLPAPQACVAGSTTSDNSLTGLGAYAILGVGNFRQDCGQACTLNSFGSSANPGLYFSCPATGCNQIPVSYAQQLQNPVSMFSTDNNGSILELNTVSTEGSTVTGSLVFGIGTQSNNTALSASHIIYLDGYGELVTLFSPLNQQQQSFPGSFVDSGSNGYYFLDQTYDPRLIQCSDENQFYCPTSVLSLNIQNTDDNGQIALNSTIKVGNADQLPGTGAIDNLGGIYDNPAAFDFGLPFFYGRNVYTALEGVSGGTPTGSGQYVAY
jgi:Protein of unknown function (DUF3443)